MSTKKRKMLIRIDPVLGKALGIIARADNKSNYELIELIVIKWIKENEQDVYKKIVDALKL